LIGILGRGVLNNAITESTSGIYKSLKGLSNSYDAKLKHLLIKLDLEAKLKLVKSLMGIKDHKSEQQLETLLGDGPSNSSPNDPEPAKSNLKDDSVNTTEDDECPDMIIVRPEIIDVEDCAVLSKTSNKMEGPVFVCVENLFDCIKKINDLLNQICQGAQHHRTKWLYTWRSPSYHSILPSLKTHTKILEERLDYLLRVTSLLMDHQ